ncbi:MAG TPA: hypothetical protein VGK89_10210 [Candidatus Eisenbacteria bacterium]|jgi:hypothetical protein
MNLGGVLRARARALRNALLRRGRPGAGAPPGPLSSLVMVGIVAWLAHKGLAALFGALEHSGATPAELRAALALALDLALVVLVVFDLEGAVATLILDRDLELLRRAPLPPGSILAIKLVDAFPRTAVPLAGLALPALVAWTGTHPAPIAAWLAAPLLAALLWLIPFGIGLAASLALLARVPARRARESLGLISTLAITAALAANLFLVPRLASESGEPMERVRALLAAARPWLALTPGGWAADAFALTAPGERARAALLLAGAAGVSLALAALAARRHLASVLDAARTPAPPLGAGRRRRRAAPRGRASLLRAVMRRDRLLYLRDWTVLGEVLAGAVLWTLLPLIAQPALKLRSPALVRAMLLLLAVGGLGYETATRAFPIERRGAAWMRLSPIPPLRWALAKFASAGSLALVLVGVAGLGLGIAAHLGPRDWIVTASTVLPALALAVAIGLWTGARFGDPDWTHPRALLTMEGRLVANGLTAAQVAAWLAVAALGETSAAPPPWSTGLASIVGAALAMAAVTRRVGRPGYHG